MYASERRAIYGSGDSVLFTDKFLVEALKQGAPLAIGVDHPEYHASLEPVAADVRDALVKDLM